MSKSIHALLAITAVASAMAISAPAFAINPQPLPPLVARGHVSPGSPNMRNSFGGSAVMLNPQPLPPRQSFSR